MDELVTTIASTILGRNSSFGGITSSVDDDHFDQRLQRLKTVSYGIVGAIVIALGILGNIINLVVLTRPTLKGVTFVYLTWLAISDLMSLVVSTTSLLRLQGIQPRTYASAVYYSYVELPLVNAFMASSVFLVITVTVDRYFSVCHPTRYKEIHTVRLARRSIMAAYVAAFALYIPTCFQNEPVMVTNARNETEYIPRHDPTIFSHKAFRVYLWIKEIFVRLGPVVLLAMLNIMIIFTFRKAVRKRRVLLSNAATTTNNQQRAANKKFREEGRLVALLAGVVIMFCTCMTPASILTLLNSDDKERSYGFQFFRAVANVLELANYAMNFYVYCLCSSDFRRTLLSLFPCSMGFSLDNSATHSKSASQHAEGDSKV